MRRTRRQGFPAEGSAGSYFAEHNWGYGTLRDGSTIEYRVDRPRWQVAPAQIKDWSCSAGQMYGGAFAPMPGEGPGISFLGARLAGESKARAASSDVVNQAQPTVLRPRGA